MNANFVPEARISVRRSGYGDEKNKSSFNIIEIRWTVCSLNVISVIARKKSCFCQYANKMAFNINGNSRKRGDAEWTVVEIFFLIVVLTSRKITINKPTYMEL